MNVCNRDLTMVDSIKILAVIVAAIIVAYYANVNAYILLLVLVFVPGLIIYRVCKPL